MLTLSFAPGASSMAIHVTLQEIQRRVRGAPVVLPPPGEPQPTNLALNSAGKVPTFPIDGRLLAEIAAILSCPARRFPDAGPLSEDAEAEAHALSWMPSAASTLHPARRQGLDHAMSAWEDADWNRIDGR